MNVYWQCLNRACGEAAPAMTSEIERETRACICGSPMQKRVQPAVFSYLNFLREEEIAQPEEITGKEQVSCEKQETAGRT